VSKNRKLLLFDIDGTLLLTGGTGRIAIEQCFEEMFGIREAWGETIPDGKTDPVIFEEIAHRTLGRPLAPEEHHHMRQRYTLYFQQMIGAAPHFRLMPGVEALVPLLARDPALILGIQTGNDEPIAWMKLERAQLKAHFSFGGFGSDSHLRTEIIRKAAERGLARAGVALDRKDIWVIGDATQDIQAGRALGFTTVAVATGRTPAAALAALQPDYLLQDFANTADFLTLLTRFSL
jgi:phosphoglycolate phosphatase-like HAD superfamily hydrolase